MTRRSLLSLMPMTAWMGPANSRQQQRHGAEEYPYIIAFCSSNRAIGEVQLVVFPVDRQALRINLPVELHGYAFASDGRALYTGGGGGVSKIEFNPARVSLVPGSVGLSVGDIAVSKDQNKILISGLYRPNKNELKGVFEVIASTGEVRQVLSQEEYSAKTRWGYLSLSPDGKRATALHNYRVELIDLAGGTTMSLGDGLEMAAWSPDGKWLAALESGGQQRTILMEADSLTQRRILGTSDLAWSPDSRYLIGWKKHDFCGSYWGTLESIDIATGKRVTIESSRCKVNQPTTGWVSREIIG